MSFVEIGDEHLFKLKIQKGTWSYLLSIGDRESPFDFFLPDDINLDLRAFLHSRDFVLRITPERGVEMQKDVYVWFIDYRKVFDKVKHKEQFEDLSNLVLSDKDLRLLTSLYWNQSACIRVDRECSKYINIERRVRQGCVMSQDLFNYYSELILRELEKGTKNWRPKHYKSALRRWHSLTLLLAGPSEATGCSGYREWTKGVVK